MCVSTMPGCGSASPHSASGLGLTRGSDCLRRGRLAATAEIVRNDHRRIAMNYTDLLATIARHADWLADKPGGARADLASAARRPAHPRSWISCSPRPNCTPAPIWAWLTLRSRACARRRWKRCGPQEAASNPVIASRKTAVRRSTPASWVMGDITGRAHDRPARRAGLADVCVRVGGGASRLFRCR